MTHPHGGQRRAAAAHYGIPEHEWLDVSTGIAPWPWPVPPIPDTVWTRLPETDDGLLEAAATYYGQSPDRLTALPGSQFAIRELPRLLAPARVAVPGIGYTEHARAWSAAGHELMFYDSIEALIAAPGRIDHAVVIYPNNPTGEAAALDRLAVVGERLGAGRLIVDAAFADCLSDPGIEALPDNAIVLRSVGKFFGLAGIRLGFAIGVGPEIESLRSAVAPWGVARPARWIGRRALADGEWQAGQQRRIRQTETWLRALLVDTFPGRPVTSAGLFATVWFDTAHEAPDCHAALAEQGVLARLGDNKRWLRLGLPNEAGRDRLAGALSTLR